jgi:hypothetical protein
VWQQLTTDAADGQDVAHAAQKATAGFFAVAAALGDSLSPLPNQQLLPVYLEGGSEAQAALRRLKERAKAAGADLLELILSGSMADWEAFIISSFQAGCSADIQEATAQHQVGVMGHAWHVTANSSMSHVTVGSHAALWEWSHVRPTHAMATQQLWACVLRRASPRAVHVASYPLLDTETCVFRGQLATYAACTSLPWLMAAACAALCFTDSTSGNQAPVLLGKPDHASAAAPAFCHCSWFTSSGYCCCWAAHSATGSQVSA